MPAKKPLLPHLIEEYHPTKNAVSLEELKRTAPGKVWWRCSKGHEWEATYSARSKPDGTGCPGCSGRQITPGENDLATLNPSLAAQWHPSKNGELLPSQIARTSLRKVWWLCDNGHEWEANVLSRYESSRCPLCNGSKIISGINDLASQRPDLLALWHPTKNNKLDPSLTGPSSNREIAWICEQGHEWTAKAIGHKGTCPVCENRQLASRVNDVRSRYPKVADEWDVERNGMEASDVLASGIALPRHWICPKGHRWQGSLAERANGRTCDVCRGRRVISGDNDLATLRPDLAQEWHPTKNEGLTPDQVTTITTQAAWWECPLGHAWKTGISARVKGRNCTICAGVHVLVGFNDLATTHPDFASQWHPTKNGDLTPQQVGSGSSKRAWWECEKGHEWDAVIVSRIGNNSGCPFCSNRRFDPEINSLEVLRPDIAAEWHPTKNGDLTPRGIGVGVNKKVWWRCSTNPKHEWDATVISRTSSGQKCPLCSGRRVVADVNSLAALRPDIAAEWHPSKNGKITPEQVTEQSNKKVWWKCKEEGHEWETRVQGRTLVNNGCPYCSNTAILIGYNDLATTHPEVAKYWHSTRNGDLTPQDVSFGAHRLAWWLCDKGHEVEAVIADRSRGIGCRQCGNLVSRGEREVADFIESLGLEIMCNNRKLIGRKELDIFIPSLNIAVEFNGIFWHSSRFSSDSFKDYNKWKACQEKGIRLIAVWEDDWENRQEIVKRMLAHKLGKSQGERVFARKTQVVNVRAQEANAFLDAHHIQGSVQGASHYGLKQGDELVAVMSVRMENKGSSALIARYATSAQVVGGFGKLLSHAQESLSVDEFVSFSDNSISDGSLYSSMGFIRDKELPPDYMYIRQGNAQRQHKFNYRISRFKDDPLLTYQEGMSERELAEVNDLYRVYDYGKVRWVLPQGS